MGVKRRRGLYALRANCYTLRGSASVVRGGGAWTRCASGAGGRRAPGALAELAGRLAKKGINIDCAHATMSKGAKKAVVVLALCGPTV